MFMVQLLYASTAENINPQVIDDILKKSQRNNAEHHITGMLHFNRKYFLQCLEGSRKKVNLIYHKILNDSRHSNPMLLSYHGISQRSFTSWSMAYVGEGIANKEAFFKYSLESEFDPYKMNGESAQGLLKELSAYAKK